MEINSTLIQGLAQAIIGGGQQAPQPPAPPPAEPPAGTVEPSSGFATPEQIDGPALVNQPEDANGILTSGEKEVLDLFFNGQGEMDLTLYGPQSPKPALLGNFLDVRG